MDKSNLEAAKNVILAWSARKSILLAQASVDDLAEEIVRLLPEKE
jgi:hypothetical protein